MKRPRTATKVFRSTAQIILGTILMVWTSAPATAQETAMTRLNAADREKLVTSVCEKLAVVYPIEDIGARTRQGIMENYRAGAYDAITSPKDFAYRLTTDLESLSADKHLDLYYNPKMAAEITAREAERDEAEGDVLSGVNPSEVEYARWENFGFKELRILDGHVGYLDLRVFFASQYAGATAVAAMEFLSQANALIIDLRRNGGGWDDMVTLLASYFVEPGKEDVLAISQSTLDNSYFASVLSAYVPGKRLTGIPVYVLVSSSTASAAEAFASILKHLNRNVILVGETTAGAENPVEYVVLTQDFVLKIPCYKKLFFGTRAGWEGAGITPDIGVPADRALEVAHLHALRLLQDRLDGDVAQQMLQWGIDGRRVIGEPAKVARQLLESYAGAYGSTRIILEGEDLFLNGNDRPRHKLLAVSDAYFVVADRDDLRIRFVSEDDRVVGVERIYSDGYRAFTTRN